MANELKTFTSLDNEYDLGLSDVSKSKPSEIVNNAFNEAKTTTAELTAHIKSAIQSIDITSYTQQAKDAVSSVKERLGINKISQAIKDVKESEMVREARALYQTAMDLSKLSVADLEKFVIDLFPGDPTTQNLLKKISASCRNDSLSNITAGRPYDIGASCDGQAGTGGGCSVAEITGIFDKLSGGAYTGVVNDKNRALKRMITLGNLGYGANLCGIMNIVIKNVDIDVVSRGASAILLQQATRGNSKAVMDISKSADTTKPLVEAPNALEEGFANFTKPNGTKEHNLPTLSDQYMGAMELLDENWMKSKEDGIISIDIVNQGNAYLEVAEASVIDTVPDEGDLDFIPGGDQHIAMTAYVASARA